MQLGWKRDWASGFVYQNKSSESDHGPGLLLGTYQGVWRWWRQDSSDPENAPFAHLGLVCFDLNRLLIWWNLAPFTPFVWIDRTAGVKISSKLKSVTMKRMLKAATCLLVMSHAFRVWRSKRLFLLCKRLCSGILQKYQAGLFFTGGHTHWLDLKRVGIGKWTGLTLRISPPTHSHKFTHQWVAEFRVELLTAQPYNTTTYQLCCWTKADTQHTHLVWYMGLPRAWVSVFFTVAWWPNEWHSERV